MRVVFVVGATASGKSAYALDQAIKNKGAIVNCDSIQVYQGLKIGSALPTAEEMARVPHFLFSYVPKGQKMTAGIYTRDFFEQMKLIEKKFEVVYVVGGTGFYFQAIEAGMYPEGAADQKLRTELEEQVKTVEGAKKLYDDFWARDPVAALKIFPNDHYRLVRAMELMLTQNKTLTEIKNSFKDQKSEFPWPLEKVGIQISKEALLPRVQARTKKMLKDGLVEEVQSLINEGFADWSTLQSVGYREVLMYLQGTRDEKDKVMIPDIRSLQEKIIIGTMQLAKKQRTWFQRDAAIRWLNL